jgi:4-amino-4-deoxy-L-arabinose transferase-like glycosyltransferase
MAEPRRFGVEDLVLLLLVLGVAAGLRALYLNAEADYSQSDPVHVQDPSPRLPLPRHPSEMESLVHNLKEHTWFGTLAPFADREEQTAHRAPGLPWILGGIAKIVSADSFPNTVRWLNAALGTLAAGVYFLFARRAFRSLTVATVAGLLCAAHPFWIANTRLYDDGPLTCFLLGVTLLLGARAGQTGGPFASLLYGLSLAGVSLVRPALLPFAFVALVWFLLRSRALARGWLCGLLAFLGFANGLAPWTVRNIQVFGEPMPVVDSLYLHLWIGNNPRATGGPMTEQQLLEVAPRHRMRDDNGKPLPQPARYAALAEPMFKEIREDVGATVQRRVHAALCFFAGERMLTQGRPADGAPLWLQTCLNTALILMLFLAALGWRWSYLWRLESMPASLAVIWVPIPYILSHAEALSGPRLPLDGVLLTYAAFALCCLLPKIGRPLRERIAT